MAQNLLFYQLLLIALVLICLLIHVWWPATPRATVHRPLKPDKPRRQRFKEPTPFAGLIHKPICDACERAGAPRPQTPSSPPPVLRFTSGRKRTIDTQHHFCPGQNCVYYGWPGRGNIRANGHPGGKSWQQLECVVCHGYFQETHGTIFYGKHESAELIGRVIACLAEGLGIRGTARVFEIDPNPVLAWLVEAAEQLRAFSQYFLHDLHLSQVQLDELYAVLHAVKDGQVSEDEAIECLSRSPQWVWTAMAPESKLLLTIEVGARTLAMAQGVVHQVVQVLAPDYVPLFLTDGFKEYRTALLAHYGCWVQPLRRHAQGAAPQPRWMPLPQLLYAQVIKTVRRRHLVAVSHRVVFGTLEAVQQVLATHGWQINTAFIEVRPVGRKEVPASG